MVTLHLKHQWQGADRHMLHGAWRLMWASAVGTNRAEHREAGISRHARFQMISRWRGSMHAQPHTPMGLKLQGVGTVLASTIVGKHRKGNRWAVFFIRHTESHKHTLARNSAATHSADKLPNWRRTHSAIQSGIGTRTQRRQFTSHLLAWANQ